MKVPAEVPLLLHNPAGCTPLFAAKYKVPLTFVKYFGVELPLPGKISRTKTVPVAVPSVFQSSCPVVEVLAVK
jgi:hypothetical protein